MHASCPKQRVAKSGGANRSTEIIFDFYYFLIFKNFKNFKNYKLKFFFNNLLIIILIIKIY
jgi:hypothetical protein